MFSMKDLMWPSYIGPKKRIRNASPPIQKVESVACAYVFRNYAKWLCLSILPIQYSKNGEWGAAARGTSKSRINILGSQ
jgi:hypothetical protein